MSGGTGKLPIVALDRVEMRFESWNWPFASERRAEIDGYFAQVQREKPAVWNGRVLLMRQYALTANAMQGTFFETDFASLLAWRAFGFPDRTVKTCFPMCALRSSDGAFLLGLMAPHTANADQLYFPTGTPDLSDRHGDRVAFDGALMRELREETGLTAADVVAARGWHAVLAGPRLPLIKLLQVAEPAVSLRQRILAFLAGEREPELCDIVIVRSGADFDPRMPEYVTAYLTDFWSHAS